ncbi:MAG: hypothetical protein HQM03_12580 [Magnetococcales bacterium]|nr:hypothetical protein [Magnetococcales bacterium]
MNVMVSMRPDLCHLLVQGEALDPEEEATLRRHLETPMDRPMEVTFFESEWFDPVRVADLAAFSRRNPGNCVTVYHPHLFAYLHGLGISVRLVVPDPPPVRERRFAALALGGSTGSLEKLLQILRDLPSGALALFVVQHVPEETPNLLDRILTTESHYRVEMPHNMTPIRPGTLYVAPSGYNMRVGNGLVYVTRDARIHHARPSIDALFESVARAYGATAMAMLLCGHGRDGVEGLACVRELGGLSLAEDPGECGEASGLVAAALENGACNHVLPVSALASFAAAAALGDSPLTAGVMRVFLAAVAQCHGYDFTHYREESLLRRCGVAMTGERTASFFAFQELVLTTPAAFERFFFALSINVTHFFRSPGQFLCLRDEVFPCLASFPRIKIWVAGCATGEEAYSLAMLLDEAGLLARSSIYATDINPLVLKEARNGLYPAHGLAQARVNHALAGGARPFDDHCAIREHWFAIAPGLREKLFFYHHSLVSDGPFNEFQLILCRNLLIYFDEELQARVIGLFIRSLHHDGRLMLGPSESLWRIAGADRLMPVNEKMRLYRVREVEEVEHDG